MEIVTQPKVEGWFYAFFGPILLFGAVGALLLEGFEGAVYLALAAAVFGSVPVLLKRCRTYCRATVDESGLTLRPERQGRLAAKPRAFHWDEVRKVGRWPLSAHNPEAGLRIMLDRPQRFWTLRPQPGNLVAIPPAIAQNVHFIEALQRYVPADRIAPGALHFRKIPFPMRRRIIGALILLACVVWASWGVAQVVHGGSLLDAMESAVMAGTAGGVALSLCTEFSPVAAFIIGTWIVAVMYMPFMMLLSALAGSSPMTAGYLSANVGALVAATVLVLIGRPRWRHALVFYALIAIGFVAGSSLYDGIPVTRVATGHLPLLDCWTPSGDGFLISTAKRIPGMSDEPSGSTDMQWYDEDLRLGDRLTLPKDPEVQAVGQEGALVLTRSEEAAELWFLPRRSGPARKLVASDGLRRFKESPSKRYVVFCREGKKEEAWERCDVETGQPMHLDLPATMEGAWARWGKDDSTVVWTVGSPPCEGNGTPLHWSAPLPKNGVIANPGKLYRLWVWKAGAAPQSYVAKTQWLASHFVAREERLYVCRVAENPPLRKEFVAIEFSGPEIAIAETTEEAFTQLSKPLPASARRYEAIGEGMMLSGRAFIKETATGKRWFLRHGFAMGGFGDPAQWSPRGDRFLMTGLEWRMRSDFWCWRMNPVENLSNGATVYMVKVETPPTWATQKGEIR